jgi:hypothetical protein
VNEKDYQTKSRVKNPHAQAVFMLMGFDWLDEAAQRRMLKKAYDRPENATVKIGDYFMILDYFEKINGISELGKSREEFVTAMGAVQRAAEAKQSRLLQGLFGA